jgi:hypothetical protein
MFDGESNASSTSPLKVTLLTPTNYHVWAPKARVRLMALGLWSYVDGKKERPVLPTGATTDDGKGVKDDPFSSSLSSPTQREAEKEMRELAKRRDLWVEKDERATASIVSLIREDLHPICKEGMTSKELWDAIEVKYGKQSITESGTTFDSLISRRYLDGEDMTSHIDSLRNTNLQLTKTPFHMSEEQMMYVLLKSLPPSWEPLKMSLRTAIATNAAFDFDRMASLLREQADQMHRGAQSGTATNPIALAHPQPTRGGQNQQSPKKLKEPPYNCSHHGKNGTHDSAHCRQLLRTAARQSKTTKPPTGPAPVAALITSPFDHESDEELDEAGQCVLTVDENGREATLLMESALPILPLSNGRGTPSITGSSRIYPVIADTGASSHLWKEDVNTLTDYIPVQHRYVMTGDGQRHSIQGIGTLRGSTLCGDSSVQVALHRVCHVPTLAFNLISLGRLDDEGYRSTQFKGTSITVDKQGRTVFIAEKKGKGQVYRSSLSISPPPTADVTLTVADTCGETMSEMTKWHYRLCHTSPTAILSMFKQELVTGVDCKAIVRQLSLGNIPHTVDCTACQIGKSKRKPFTRVSERATRCLQRLHTDVCGPLRVKGRKGELYFLTITDDYSRYGFGAAMDQKDSVTVGTIIRDWILWAENQHSDKGHRVQFLRSDNGGEFVNDFLGPWLRSKGIEQELTTAHTPQLNGVAERFNLTLMDKVRTILTHSGAPEYFWPDCLLAVIHVHNRTSHKSLPSDTTPFHRWYGKPPRVNALHPFGCICYVHVPKTTARGKLDPRAIVGMMVGYSQSGNGYKVWDIYGGRGRVIESRDCDFREWQYYGMLPVSGGRGGVIRAMDSTSSTKNDSITITDHLPTNDSDDTDDATEDVTVPSTDVSQHPTEQRDSQHPTEQRDATTSSNLLDSSGINAIPTEDIGGRRLRGRELASLQDFMSSGDKDNAPSTLGSRMAARQTPLNMAMTELSTDEPRSYREAMAGPQAEQWTGGCIKEMDQLHHNKTWVLVKPPPDTNIVGCKWVMKLKVMPDGSVKYKARLVAQGFTQKPGIDYEETYSPVVRYASLRALFGLAAHYSWEVHHMDVKSAYLNGTLQETIYMRQPEGFIEAGKEHYVCQLKKGLYGLKQAGRCWNHTIDPALCKLGLTPLDKDSCVYLHRSEGEMIVICLYVDDLFLFTASTRLLKHFKEGLKAKFEMEDLGEAKLVLGMQITRDRTNRTVTISQEAYLRKFIDRLNLSDMKGVPTPMVPNTTLVKAPPGHIASKQDITRYQSIIGSLMYAANGTRPDIAFTINKLSKYSSNPDSTHLSALKHLLRYVRGTIDYALTYKGTGDQHPPLTAYCDADFANDRDDRLSVSGYVVMLCGGVISWAARRQTVIADSTVNAEYIAIAEATKDVMWWRPLLKQLGYDTSAPTLLLNDNQGSIQLAHNGDNSTRSKAIDVKYHLIRQELREKTINLSYVSTEHNVADILTKGLTRDRHRLLTAALGVAHA